MPALYTLHFLDVPITYTNNRFRLSNDPEFPLNTYPSMDAKTAGVRADPYCPQTHGNLVRYPGNLGFDPTELDYGWQVFLQMNYPIQDPAMARRFYNIRGVRTQPDQQTPISDTVGSVTWDWIPSNFNPADPSPIVDGGNVPGDNTQPAWTARLVTNDPSHSIAVKGDDLEHMFLMNSAQTLEAISSILCPMRAAMKRPAKPRPVTPPASSQDVNRFLQSLYRYKWEHDWLPINDAEAFRVLRQELKVNLGSIARRIMMDIMKRPQPPEAVKPRGGAPAAPDARPTTKRRSGPQIASPGRKAARATARRPRSKSGKK
jgi:hypothetical protein